MQVILLEDIRNLGKIGEVVNGRDGYGRNFLIKFGKALRADKKNIDYVNRKRSEINKKNVEQKKIAKENRKQSDTNESGILYRAGVKKYGKAGMKAIQSAAAKGANHQELSLIHI